MMTDERFKRLRDRNLSALAKLPDGNAIDDFPALLQALEKWGRKIERMEQAIKWHCYYCDEPCCACCDELCCDRSSCPHWLAGMEIEA